MIPIYEQGNGSGIGHPFDRFLSRFREICRQHLEAKRAKAFAFLFYDFSDKAIKGILKNRDGFIQLDRLAGKDLSVFYLNSNRNQGVDEFNNVFQTIFDVEEIERPFVLFLKFDPDVNEIVDLKIVILEHANYFNAFHELYGVIESYVSQLNDKEININTKQNIVKNAIEQFSKLALEEFIKLCLEKAYNNIVT